MRRHALAALLVLLASCVAASVAVAANGKPKEAFRPADQALAKSIVLTRADLPAGTWKGERSSSGGGFQCPGFKVDQSDLTITGRSSGYEFTSEGSGSFVSSTAGIYVTAAQARTAFLRIARPGLGRCLANLFEQGVGTSAKVRIVSSGAMAFPNVAQDTRAFRLVPFAPLRTLAALVGRRMARA